MGKNTEGKMSAVKFRAGVRQFQTLMSGEVTLTLSLKGADMDKVFRLLEERSKGAVFQITATPVFISPEESKKDAKKDKDNQGRKTRKRQRYPYRG